MKNSIKLCVIVAISFLVACDDKPTKTTEQTVASQQQAEPAVDESKLPLYRVATMSTYPPFATKDELGVVTGFDIDVLKLIAKNQDFRIEFVVHPWSKWKEDLTKNDGIDIWTAGITIKDDRKKVVDFSDPYMSDNTAILMRFDSNHITPENFGEYKVGVEKQSRAVTIAQSMVADSAKIKKFPSNYLAFEALAQKKIDVLLGNEAVLANMAKSFPELKFIEKQINNSKKQNQLGFMIRKGNPDMLNKINQGLKEIKANGELDKIKYKWFGDLVK